MSQRSSATAETVGAAQVASTKKKSTVKVNNGQASENGEISNPDGARPDPDLISFEGDSDAEDPKNWSGRYKWSLVVIMAGMALTLNLNVLVCAPSIPTILRDFHSTSSAEETLLVSIWNLGAVFGSLLMGPLSELYGRRPVYNMANLLCFLVLVGQALSPSLAALLVFRCLNGLTVAATSLNGAIVGDLFTAEQRGRVQSLLQLMALLGPTIGPIAGGWLAQTKGWRWTFWFTGIVLASFSLAFAACYRETYDAQILRRKAKKLRAEKRNSALHSKYDHPPSAAAATLARAFSRPLRVFSVPIFLMVAVPGCIVTGYTYLVAASITAVFESIYGFSEGAAGLVFLGISIGMALSAAFCSLVLDPYTKRMKARHDGQIKPEWRLPPMVLGFLSAPLGLFVYGWTAQARVQYVAPVIGTVLIGFGSFVIFIPMTTYFVDVFGTYRASALSAMAVFRNALSTVLPLAAPALYGRLGVGWGNSVLAFVALGLAPIPILLLRFGERIRKSSRLEEW